MRLERLLYKVLRMWISVKQFRSKLSKDVYSISKRAKKEKQVKLKKRRSGERELKVIHKCHES